MRPTIAFLHGWGRTSRDFDRLLELLTASGCESMVFDFPGFGQALAPPTAWSVGDYAAYVRRELAARGVPRAILIGHSFGARVAVVLAALYPELVANLVLIGAPLVRSLTFERWLLILLARLWRSVRWLPGAAALKRLAEAYLRQRHYSLDILLTAEGVMRETFKKVIEENLEPYLRRIKVPILLVYGERDMVTGLAINQRVLSYLPHAKLVAVKEAGHMVILEKPEVVAKEIERFINL